MNKLLSTLLTTTVVMTTAVGCTSTTPEQTTGPKNIIMVVGDGMGPAYTSAYRVYKDNPNTPAVETTVFDDILIGRSTTYPAKISGVVTDSAASATALATGHKSYNGAIGVDVDVKPLETVMEYAKSIGKSTGLVVTSQINHATPASYAAHVKQRKMYNDIADQFFDNRVNGAHTVDVMLGGGTEYFKRDDRDITQQFSDAGYQYIDQYSQLSSVNNDKLLGLFAPVGLPWALDDSNKHRLKAMTKVALDRLDNNENGFFLLVEGSQVDWAGHSNDIAAAMAEMDDLAATIAYLKSYVKTNPDTLVVITADHSTGGFTIGANGDYAWKPQILHKLSASPEALAKAQTAETLDVAMLNDKLGFELTQGEIDNLAAAHKQSGKALYKAIKKMLDVRTNTGWTTSGHTGVDVPVFAFGPHKNDFKGQVDNTDIAKKIFTLLGK